MNINRNQSTTSWRKNTLRPFESMASLGAKYCHLNKVSIKVFGEVLAEFLPPDVSTPESTCTVDTVGFNISGFSKMLDEPLALIRSQSARQISLGATFQEVCSVGNVSFNELRFCPECLADGYHSTLHQLSWLEKCFLHSIPLIEHRIRPKSIHRHLSGDTKLIGALYQSWFGTERVWQEAYSSTWTTSNNTSIYQSAKNLVKQLGATESALIEIQRRHDQLPRVIGNSASVRVMMTMKSVNTSNKKVIELLMPVNCSIKRTHYFQCTTEQANTILQLDKYYLSVLMHARQLMCNSLQLTPLWKQTLKGLEKKLINGHEKCLHHFQKLYLVGMLIRVHGAPYDLSAPFDLSLFSKVPCKRLATIRCLEEMIDVEQLNQASGLSLSDISFKQNRWDQAEFSDLISQYSGFISRNENRIIHMDSENKEVEPVLQEQIDHDRRLVNISVPLGPLAEIIDEMLLSYIWSWTWALFSVEMQSDRLVDSGTDPKKFLAKELEKLSPIFTIQKNSMGLTLRIGSFVPYRHPSWKADLERDSIHILEVKHKTKIMGDFFQSRLAKVKEEYERYLPRLPWIDQRPSK